MKEDVWEKFLDYRLYIKKQFIAVRFISMFTGGVSIHIKDAVIWFWLRLIQCHPTEMMFLVADFDTWNCLNNEMSWQMNRESMTYDVI